MRTFDVATIYDTVALALADPTVRPRPQTADDDGTIPAELRRWLTDLRLLEAVPFSYLVADSDLLPEESIRWFYLDRRWTDALVQGALSVGTVNSDDRTQLAAQYPAIRDELDSEERQRRRGPGAPRLTGDGGPVSGFLLRSKAVSGWPGMHVRAFSVDPPEADDATYSDDDPRRLRLLRLERLAPAVLLCLFDGVPEVVHLEEPRQGIQFGFKADLVGSSLTAEMKPRDVATFEYLPGAPVTVPFRGGASGVVDIKKLERRLAPRVGSGAADGLDSAEYALQLVQRPWRQVWGDDEHPAVDAVFTAGIAYQAIARTFLEVQP